LNLAKTFGVAWRHAATRTAVFGCYVFRVKRNCQNAECNFDMMFGGGGEGGGGGEEEE
jgi:hypothetical protein